jgi:hypothetical protein
VHTTSQPCDFTIPDSLVLFLVERLCQWSGPRKLFLIWISIWFDRKSLIFQNANKEWLGDGTWLGEHIVCRRGGDVAIPTISGQCASTKFIVKGASVPIRSDDADAKILPWYAVSHLRQPAFE